MLFFVPIEPFDQRYTADWYTLFPDEFMRKKIAWAVVSGDSFQTDIKDGRFLDICGTIAYKAKQLRDLSYLFYKNHIRDGDQILFADGWWPGLEGVAYMRDLLNVDVELYAIFHAGTYDEWDHLSQTDVRFWGKWQENAWLKILDGVFVATEFHKKLLNTRRNVDYDKIYVTGLPFYNKKQFSVKTSSDERNQKENIVVFPHRLDEEKNPYDFDRMRDELGKNFPEWTFIKTMESYTTKDSYYTILKKAKIAVSSAYQETWGIAMQEAVMCGCIPVVPYRLSYAEMYSDPFFYLNTYEQMRDLVKYFMIVFGEPSHHSEINNILSKVESLQNKFIISGEMAIHNILVKMGYKW